MGEKDKISLIEVFFGTPWEAELIKGLLESAGIDVALKNYGLVNFVPTQSTDFGAGGGISVLVFKDDYEIARQLIESRENLK
ncbi:DUF2007-related protein [Bacteroides sedimenti]|uniref:DUF2007 domain-containing protein n=1 Tax=Bacteroides sedimenti TaxID=2136147 RepID=A0ABM8IF62_9BACE